MIYERTENVFFSLFAKKFWLFSLIFQHGNVWALMALRIVIYVHWNNDALNLS